MKEYLMSVFHAQSIFFILFESYWLICAKKLRARIEKQNREMEEAKKNGGSLELPNIDKVLLFSYCVDVVYFVWALIGLFTNQCLLYCGLLFLTFAMPKKSSELLHQTNAVLSIAILLIIWSNAGYGLPFLHFLTFNFPLLIGSN